VLGIAKSAPFTRALSSPPPAQRAADMAGAASPARPGSANVGSR
jgi:hypothetical protein